jgi:hypothetical protein
MSFTSNLLFDLTDEVLAFAAPEIPAAPEDEPSAREPSCEDGMCEDETGVTSNLLLLFGLSWFPPNTLPLLLAERPPLAPGGSVVRVTTGFAAEGIADDGLVSALGAGSDVKDEEFDIDVPPPTPPLALPPYIAPYIGDWIPVGNGSMSSSIKLFNLALSLSDMSTSDTVKRPFFCRAMTLRFGSVTPEAGKPA